MPDVYDSGLYSNEPTIATIKPGMIVAYRLLPKDMPVDPNKVWRGKVVHCNEHSILLELLEPGYSELQETITYQQIIGVSE